MERSPISESLRLLKINYLSQIRTQKVFEEWWQANGKAWAEQLRAAMISHCDIGHDWQFSDQQRKGLNNYYDANQLLLN